MRALDTSPEQAEVRRRICEHLSRGRKGFVNKVAYPLPDQHRRRMTLSERRCSGARRAGSRIIVNIGLFDDRTGRWARLAARTLSGAASLRVTSTYTVMLLAVSLTLTAMGPHARAVAVSRMSTNLHNLAHGHVDTLVGSALVNDGDGVFFWLPGLVCLLALGEITWRSMGLVVTFAVGHIATSLIVAVGLVVAIRTGSLPSSIARSSDVGMSYGAVCVLGALTTSVPARWRPTWVGWWLGVALSATLGADFTAIGHCLALLLGIGLSFRLRSIARWTPRHATLLVVGAAFGYLVLAGPSVVAPAWGLSGALVAQLLRRIGPSSNVKDSERLSSTERVVASPRALSGAPATSYYPDTAVSVSTW